MKRYIIQLGIFIGISSVSFLLLLLKADGKSDPFYLRFTTPKQNNLIIGLSRAAQGIQPQRLKNIIGADFYNYSFTITDSPYGPAYYKSIQKKLDESTQNGIFIIEVSPWGICAASANPNDSLLFEENEACVGKMNDVNRYPNYEYLLTFFSGQFDKIFLRPMKTMLLHDDGWLEVTIPMDSAVVALRAHNKIKFYKEINLPQYKYSTLRYAYLMKTIDLLKDHGTVYLVRLPIHPEMKEVEHLFMHDFNEKMIELSKQKNVPYLDLTKYNSDFIYTDGNHLYKESGKIVSDTIANWVRTYQ